MCVEIWSLVVMTVGVSCGDEGHMMGDCYRSAISAVSHVCQTVNTERILSDFRFQPLKLKKLETGTLIVTNLFVVMIYACSSGVADQP